MSGRVWRRRHDREHDLMAELERQGMPPPTPMQVFESGPLSAIVARDEIAPGDQRWHISVSHKRHVPGWGEMTQAAHGLRPGIVFVIGVPPRTWWINAHPHVLHLYEIKDEPLIAQWRFEGRGDTPT